MSRPVFAFFTRSLRIESRQVAPYLARMALLGTMLLLLLGHHAQSRFRGAPGLDFFASLIYTNLVFLTAAGMIYFASAIAEEREEMTLGLLRMTRLSPLSILMGKSVSRLLGAAFLLLVQMPFTILAVALGGVAMNQVLAAYIALLGYVAFLCGLALFWSVLMKTSANAGGMTAAALAIFYAVPPLGLAVLRDLTLAGKLSSTGWFHRAATAVFEFLGDSSPFARVREVIAMGFAGSLIGFQPLSNLAGGVGFFLLAWIAFDWATREQREAAPSRWGLLKGRGRFHVLSPGRAWSRALVWKDFNFLAGGVTLMVLKSLIYGVTIVAGYVCARHWRWADNLRDYALAVAVIMSVLLFAEIVHFAGRIFGDEVRWQTLSTLVTLPLSIKRLAYAKLAGCLLGLIPAAAYWALSGVVAIGLTPRMSGEEAVNIGAGVLAGIAEAALFSHLVALMSLMMKRAGFLVALAIWWLCHQFLCCAGPLMAIDGVGPLAAALIVAQVVLLIVIALQIAIGNRLARAAAE